MLYNYKSISINHVTVQPPRSSCMTFLSMDRNKNAFASGLNARGAAGGERAKTGGSPRDWLHRPPRSRISDVLLNLHFTHYRYSI